MVDERQMLEYHLFRASDFPEYLAWYADPRLNDRLGPLDQEWLDYILGDTSGSQFCFFLSGERVAVAGVCHPGPEHPYYTLTDIAVKPGLQGRGIGRRVLATLLAMPEWPLGPPWRAHVEQDNAEALHFFRVAGWQCISEPNRDDSMYSFEYLPLSTTTATTPPRPARATLGR